MITKSYTLQCRDGSEIRVSETVNKTHVVISIHTGGECKASASLDAEDFNELCDLKYSVEHATPGQVEEEKNRRVNETGREEFRSDHQQLKGY